MSGQADPAAFPEHYGNVSYCRGSAECLALEQRYPGIRFNRVHADIFARFYFKHSNDDYVDVAFNISGTKEDLERHGFLPSRFAVRTHSGRYRLSGARYDDGLDKLAALFIPPLLERFKRGAEEARS